MTLEEVDKCVEYLNNEGTPGIGDALEGIRFGHILEPYRRCFDGSKLRWLHNGIGAKFSLIFLGKIQLSVGFLLNLHGMNG